MKNKFRQLIKAELILLAFALLLMPLALAAESCDYSNKACPQLGDAWYFAGECMAGKQPYACKQNEVVAGCSVCGCPSDRTICSVADGECYKNCGNLDVAAGQTLEYREKYCIYDNVNIQGTLHCAIDCNIASNNDLVVSSSGKITTQSYRKDASSKNLHLSAKNKIQIDGDILTAGQQGIDGAAGQIGMDGTNAGSVTMDAPTIIQNNVINARGGNGGAGGQAPDGREGYAGGKGGVAGKVTMNAASLTITKEIIASGGNGGDGGRGGNNFKEKRTVCKCTRRIVWPCESPPEGEPDWACDTTCSLCYSGNVVTNALDSLVRLIPNTDGFFGCCKDWPKDETLEVYIGEGYEGGNGGNGGSGGYVLLSSDSIQMKSLLISSISAGAAGNGKYGGQGSDRPSIYGSAGKKGANGIGGNKGEQDSKFKAFESAEIAINSPVTETIKEGNLNQLSRQSVLKVHKPFSLANANLDIDKIIIEEGGKLIPGSSDNIIKVNSIQINNKNVDSNLLSTKNLEEVALVASGIEPAGGTFKINSISLPEVVKGPSRNALNQQILTKAMISTGQAKTAETSSFKEAKEKESSKFCSITPDESQRNLCYITEAAELVDKSICSKITNPAQQNVCNQKVDLLSSQ